jgi:predicted ATP-dependent endonuclease of OLD family
MHINKISVTSFRLLANVELFLEPDTTVIVGRNNSGKTSLTELFRRLLSENTPIFRLEDFSLSRHDDFWEAFVLKRKGREGHEVREKLPCIEVRLTVSYDAEASSLGALSDFIIDLDPDCTEALVVIRYELRDGEMDSFFSDMPSDNRKKDGPKKATFFRVAKERIPKSYACTVLAEDPNDPENQKKIEWSQLRTLLQTGFISAQRGLDDTTHKEVNLLGKILESLLNSAMSDAAASEDRSIAQNLEDAIDGIQVSIDQGFNTQLQQLLPAFSLFGYPGLGDPRLLTETNLDVQRLLKDHTRVHYAGVNGVNLPEAYNGLGVRNLIFILLKLLEFFKEFVVKDSEPGVHLVFIEEPEVHLHPQMQEVFISQLNKIASVFADKIPGGRPWPVQFVVTTHSSHLANRSSFETMRYFLTSRTGTANHLWETTIKDLRHGLKPSAQVKEDGAENGEKEQAPIGCSEEDRDFLHKYMTLTRCDLLFADKAVLIEGPTERLLLPKMIEKIDGELPDGRQLASQYVSVVEVGGAYAHRFFGLLDFLELRTLIICDLDAAKKNANNRLEKCRVSESTHTTNGCIKSWFEKTDVAPAVLITKSNVDKTHGVRRLVYQVPESGGDPCGRSFEDAFILANLCMFVVDGKSTVDTEVSAWDMARDLDKTDFALEYAIEKTEWSVPRYIADGLRWLAKGDECCTGVEDAASSKGLARQTVAVSKEE